MTPNPGTMGLGATLSGTGAWKNKKEALTKIATKAFEWRKSTADITNNCNFVSYCLLIDFVCSSRGCKPKLCLSFRFNDNNFWMSCGWHVILWVCYKFLIRPPIFIFHIQRTQKCGWYRKLVFLYINISFASSGDSFCLSFLLFACLHKSIYQFQSCRATWLVAGVVALASL